MPQYIDKDAVVAEIERRIKEVSQIEKASYEVGLCDAYKIVLRFLDTLEVKEVDLNAAVERYVEQHKSEMQGYMDIRRIARHFIELGLKASTERRIRYDSSTESKSL